jgi:hypothetical protein
MDRRARAACIVTLIVASLVFGGATIAACSTSSGTPAAGVDGGTSVSADSSPSTLDVSLVAIFDAPSGGPCEASTDCPPGLICLYPVAEGCSATAVCEVLPAAECAGPYCSCRGDTTAACGAYASLPMMAPLRGPPCGASGEGGTGAPDGGHDAS